MKVSRVSNTISNPCQAWQSRDFFKEFFSKDIGGDACVLTRVGGE